MNSLDTRIAESRVNDYDVGAMARHLLSYRSDIAIVEEVLTMAQEGITVIPVFVVEGILKITHCDSVGGEHIGSDSDEAANTRLALDFARIAFYQKLALFSGDSLASGSTDLKLLNMDMLVPVHMSFISAALGRLARAPCTRHTSLASSSRLAPSAPRAARGRPRRAEARSPDHSPTRRSSSRGQRDRPAAS
jgi:hypothetical protein